MSGLRDPDSRADLEHRWGSKLTDADSSHHTTTGHVLRYITVNENYTKSVALLEAQNCGLTHEWTPSGALEGVVN